MGLPVQFWRVAKATQASFLRDFVFGIEDGLVSTVGLLAGIASVDVPRSTIFVTGIILIFVEAFSMATGAFLSDESAQEYLKGKKIRTSISIIGGAIMFASYAIAGFIPLLPYVMFDTRVAMPTSIVLSILALAGLGVIHGKLSKVKVWRTMLKMSLVGGVAIIVGVVVGRVVNSF
jgi:VIT1/CCC1 family predicted Fe2+/Mn2+ transporter